MALAILELLEVGREGAKFTVDTGTSRYFQLRVGRAVAQRNGADWVDDITYSSPVRENAHGGSAFQTRADVSLPSARLGDGAGYVQLFSFKTADGRAPTYSNVVQFSSGWPLVARAPTGRVVGRPMSTTATAFEAARRIQCQTGADRYAMPASLDDVLGSIVKLAAPIVEQLLGGGKGPINVAQSLPVGPTLPTGNRFVQPEYSRPFIFGIDDALIGAVAGPLLQILPQLLNSANQRKIAEKQADTKLMADALAGINQRLMLQQLAGAQAPNAAASPDLAKLFQLLQQQAAAPAAGATAAPAVASSLSAPEPDNEVLSRRAVVGFQLRDPLPWNGEPKALFAKGANIRLTVKLTVGDPAPKSPLPKAIVRVLFRNPAERSVLIEKQFKLKDVPANAPIALDFAASELDAVPTNRPIELVTEIRWKSPSSGRVYKALGSREVVFVGKYLLKSQGSMVGTELELTDMSRFRSFWNKLWESPVLDSASGSADDKKYLWELNATVKYSILLAPDHPANGLMQTKFLKAAPDPESLTQSASGRMKSGIELSVQELNKLLPQWPGHDMLPAEQLEALTTASFAARNAGEAITSVKLRGNAGERGLVWAIPVFNLLQCTLATVAKTDETGQVTALADRVIGFPIPVSARIIGLKSKQ